MSDPVEAPSPEDPAPVQASAPKRQTRKTGARKATKRASGKPAKRVSRAASSVRVKVGGHTIAMPGNLAANLTPKDEKKLAAIFKRILKREKKDAPKKRAAKKR